MFVTETFFYFHCINCCLSFSLISGLPFGPVLEESDVPLPPSFQGRLPAEVSSSNNSFSCLATDSNEHVKSTFLCYIIRRQKFMKKL